MADDDSEEETGLLDGTRPAQQSQGLPFLSTWGALLEQQTQILPMAVGYTICSSMLMVVNKMALKVFPYPSQLMALQFLTSAAVVRLLACRGKLEAAPLEAEKVRAFWLVPAVFSVAIFTNIKLLQSASVETTIVFRTMVPLITSWADYAFMGRELPSQRSAASLLVILGGALLYSACSSGGVRVYVWGWAVAYLLVLAFEMVYVKHVLNSVPMSTWTRVYYNNVLSLALCPPFMLVGREWAQLASAASALLEPRVGGTVGLSCLLGVGISFTGFGVRNLVTSTSFTVLGVMNKVLTVLASMLIFATDASFTSVLALLVCIGGGTMYQQAPPRTAAPFGEDVK